MKGPILNHQETLEAIFEAHHRARGAALLQVLCLVEMKEDRPRGAELVLHLLVEDGFVRAVRGIRAEPAYAHTRCWPEAQTLVPAGKPHLWDAQSGLGAAGDWCTGHRVEEAFLSGLSLALAVH